MITIQINYYQIQSMIFNLFITNPKNYLTNSFIFIFYTLIISYFPTYGKSHYIKSKNLTINKVRKVLFLPKNHPYISIDY